MRFSIVIPTYNSGRYLNFCLDSVVAQNYKNLQIIIVDNCSTDNTLEIIESYKNKLEIHVFSEPDSGINDAFRKGLLKTNGDYVCHMCSTDSYASSSWFFEANKMINTFDYCDGLISDAALEIDEQSNPLYFWKPWVSVFMRSIPNEMRVEFSKLIGLSYPDMGWLIKRDFAIVNFPGEADESKYGLYAPFLGYMENIYTRGVGIVIMPSVTSTGRHHEGQWTYRVKKETKVAKSSFRTRLLLNFFKINRNKLLIMAPLFLLVYFICFNLYGGPGWLLGKLKNRVKNG
jgi:glycosyltransferase involved in cell wall biosynthesis